VTTSISGKPLYPIPHAGATKKYLDNWPFFFCQDEAALTRGSRVSIVSRSIAVRSAIAEYSRLVIAHIDVKKAPQLRVLSSII
jgi:hypothetical protein